MRSVDIMPARPIQVPRGCYMASEVGQLAGVSGKRIGQWARRGYIRSSLSDASPRIYSYQDIAEAMVVHELEDHGVAPRSIGDAVSVLREQLGTDWPLQESELHVPATHPRRKKSARSIAVRSVTGELEDVVQRHPVLGQVDLVAIKQDLARGGWAARTLPDLRYIEVDPDRLSGRPVIRGSRVAAADVARLAADLGQEAPLDEFDLEEDQVRDAVRWWGKVCEYQRAA